MADNWETTTTTDKDVRDRAFEDLRKNGNELERQAVKYSSVEPHYDLDGFLKGYRSTWSVAYPRS